MAQNSASPAQQRAEAKFSKQETRKKESEVALAAYRAEVRAVDEKTARLRAARLAKEAVDAAAAKEAAANAPPTPLKAVRVKKKKPVAAI